MIFSADIKPKKTRDKSIRFAYGVILFFVTLSILAPMIANEKPLYVDGGEETFYPILSSSKWQEYCRQNDCETTSMLIPFSPNTIDVSALKSKPGTASSSHDGKIHRLGTDGLGRDVLSGLIHGSRTAIWISVLAALIALVIGGLYGLIIGYYGEERISVSRRQLIFCSVLLMAVFFISNFLLNLFNAAILSKASTVVLFVGLFFVTLFTVLLINKTTTGSSQINLNADSIGMRVVDGVKALPPLFIVLFALQLIDQPRVYYLILLIAFLLWASLARHARAEILRLRDAESVQSALLNGKSDFWIWRYEIMPFIIRPLLVTSAFSMASAILLEATLSFLGIGMPIDHVSWGTLINEARNNADAWWLIVFPGICLLSLIWSLQHVGRVLESKLRIQKNFESIDHMDAATTI